MNLREPPLTRLPPELLALVFEELEPEERTLCTMAYRYWQSVIKGLWPVLKTSPNEILIWAAKNGNMPLMKVAKKWDAAEFDNPLQRGGPLGAQHALWGAAFGGHVDCMKLAKDWGATNFNWTLIGAAYSDHVDCMKLLKKWGANNFNEAAGTCTTIDCIKLLIEWGATGFTSPTGPTGVQGETGPTGFKGPGW